MTGPSQAGDSPTAAAHPAAARVLVAATCAALFVAPFAGSSGLRTAFLTIAGLVLLATTRGRALLEILQMPRAVLAAWAAWSLLAVASLAWSIDRALTRSELRTEILYGALALTVYFVAARRAPHRWRAWWIALVAGTATVLAGQWLQHGLGIAFSRHPIEGGVGPWSTHLVLVAPLLLAVSWPAPWGFGLAARWQVAAWVLLLLATWLSENRIAWAALGAQIAIAIALAPRIGAAGGPRLVRRRYLGVALLAVAIAFAAMVAERNAQLFERAPSVTTHLERDVRPKLWAVAWEQFKGAPWLGHGFGREILAPVFAPHTPPIPHHPVVQHAHNVFADAALELGLAGALALAALFVALAARYARLLASPATAGLGVLGLAVVAGFLVKNATDDFFYRHNAIVFWALNGMLLGLAQGAGRDAPPP